MGHYDDFYDRDHAKERAHQRDNLENFYKALREFRVWQPGRSWTFPSIAEEAWKNLEREVEANLYRMKA